MKNITKFFAIAVVILGFSASSFAQVSATATATGTIVSALTIENIANMNFGNIIPGTEGGTVVLVPAGTRTATGSVTLPAAAGTISAARFTVGGTVDAIYNITLPSTYTITNGTQSMTVSTFTSDPISLGTLTNVGVGTINVGATLTVASSQAGGVYTNTAGFPV
ncbi:MAG: DUF4402 domain-containing protein, partial [Bacteroidales bacterium]|nr:DUF4402 domain-containing protein [Bacteroidales bacterium]